MVNPTLFFHFEPGQLVLRRHKTFSKLDPKATGPFIIKGVSGIYRQRVTIQPANPNAKAQQLTTHASQLVPYEQPYVEPTFIELGNEEPPAPIRKPQGAQEGPPQRQSKRNRVES